MSNEKPVLDRRQLLAGAAIAAGVLPLGAAEAATPTAERWDHETDVLCVGSGAAACAAAIAAVDKGAKVMLVEKMPLLGGTTAKSGGVTWIPNHFLLRERGIVDDRVNCLRYLARYAYPQTYDPNSPTLGLTASDHALLAAFYDNGSVAIDRLQALGAVRFKEFRLFQVDRPAPDYADHLPENKVPTGRALEPAEGSGSEGGGGSLASQMEQWLRAKQAPILTDTRVTALVMRDGRAIGVEAEQEGRPIRIRARKGVVFGTGGYSHNVDLCARHQTALYGSCSMPGSTGDFIAIAGAAGAKMGSLHTAWRSQVLLEEALANRAVGLGAFVLPGDSMIVVNKYGDRVVNEKRCYNDRTTVHFVYDPTREEYPNQLLFMLFDQRSIDAFGGAFPFPANAGEQPYLIQGDTIEALSQNIDARLKSVAARTGHVALGDGFASAASASIARFNDYAKAGKDPEFGRGEHAYDREWHLLFSARREGTRYPPNPMPNNVMHPFTAKGPYYAFILAAGSLDTNGGPLIDAGARVLDTREKPIPGLYGAGNCIASPSRSAYYGAGGTIGLAVTFGYIAGINAAQETVV